MIYIVLGILALFALPFIGYEVNVFFQPKYEQLNRTVFEETKGYNDGMIRDLENLKVQYIAATESQKMALKAVILHRFSVYPEDRLPADLRQFYESLKGQS